MASEHGLQRFLPLVTFESATSAAEYGQVAWDAGLKVIEVAFRTAAAADAIAELRAHTELTVVAGTVTSARAVDEAIDAGAAWWISPCFDEEILDYAAARGFAVVPGIATPSELAVALRRGITEVKVYPVTPLGGIDFLRALAAVFPDVGVIPSGGVTLEQVGDYATTTGVVAVSGSWMPSVSAAQPVDGEAITRSVSALLGAVAGAD
jgi:2-dehydro-3-deoxyphosphogluconate aldolase/(4S)-4-hydroxy-2-oxoglutarate aldolase